MVEIKCSSSAEAQGEDSSIGGHEEDKYRLVYSKSKVYVNPTAYARDNIPGFVALVKRVSLVGLLMPLAAHRQTCRRR
jgi:TBC1 domain family member 15